MYPQFLQPVADTGWGRLAQQFTFWTRFGEHCFFYSGPAAWNTLPVGLHSENDSRVYFLIVLCHWLLLLYIQWLDGSIENAGPENAGLEDAGLVTGWARHTVNLSPVNSPHVIASTLVTSRDGTWKRLSINCDLHLFSCAAVDSSSSWKNTSDSASKCCMCTTKRFILV